MKEHHRPSPSEKNLCLNSFIVPAWVPKMGRPPTLVALPFLRCGLAREAFTEHFAPAPLWLALSKGYMLRALRKHLCPSLLSHLTSICTPDHGSGSFSSARSSQPDFSFTSSHVTFHHVQIYSKIFS